LTTVYSLYEHAVEFISTDRAVVKLVLSQVIGS